MLSWCFKNGFKAPPPNFTPPKPLNKCTKPITEWCSSREVASSCNVSKTILKYFLAIFKCFFLLCFI